MFLRPKQRKISKHRKFLLDNESIPYSATIKNSRNGVLNYRPKSPKRLYTNSNRATQSAIRPQPSRVSIERGKGTKKSGKQPYPNLKKHFDHSIMKLESSRKMPCREDGTSHNIEDPSKEGIYKRQVGETSAEHTSDNYSQTATNKPSKMASAEDGRMEVIGDSRTLPANGTNTSVTNATDYCLCNDTVWKVKLMNSNMELEGFVSVDVIVDKPQSEMNKPFFVECKKEIVDEEEGSSEALNNRKTNRVKRSVSKGFLPCKINPTRSIKRNKFKLHSHIKRSDEKCFTVMNCGTYSFNTSGKCPQIEVCEDDDEYQEIRNAENDISIVDSTNEVSDGNCIETTEKVKSLESLPNILNDKQKGDSLAIVPANVPKNNHSVLITSSTENNISSLIVERFSKNENNDDDIQILEEAIVLPKHLVVNVENAVHEEDRVTIIQIPDAKLPIKYIYFRETDTYTKISSSSNCQTSQYSRDRIPTPFSLPKINGQKSSDSVTIVDESRPQTMTCSDQQTLETIDSTSQSQPVSLTSATSDPSCSTLSVYNNSVKDLASIDDPRNSKELSCTSSKPHISDRRSSSERNSSFTKIPLCTRNSLTSENPPIEVVESTSVSDVSDPVSLTSATSDPSCSIRSGRKNLMNDTAFIDNPRISKRPSYNVSKSHISNISSTSDKNTRFAKHSLCTRSTSTLTENPPIENDYQISTRSTSIINTLRKSVKNSAATPSPQNTSTRNPISFTTLGSSSIPTLITSHDVPINTLPSTSFNLGRSSCDLSPPDENMDSSPPDENMDSSPPDLNMDSIPPDENMDTSPPDENMDSNSMPVLCDSRKNGIKFYVCYYCKTSYHTIQELIKHIITHGKCFACDTHCGSIENLKIHIQQEHHSCRQVEKYPRRSKSPQKDTINQYLPITKFECKKCNKTYKKRGCLKLHLRTHTAVSIKCSSCKMEFHQNLSYHAKKLLHSCAKCSRNCFGGRPGNYSKLVDFNHSPPGKYCCSICHFVFCSFPDLDTHLETHIFEKRLSCKNCDIYFKALRFQYVDEHGVSH